MYGKGIYEDSADKKSFQRAIWELVILFIIVLLYFVWEFARAVACGENCIPSIHGGAITIIIGYIVQTLLYLTRNNKGWR